MPDSPRSYPDALPEISVVIATFRRPEELERCLHALLNQSINNFEIIVADDAASNADDQTPARRLIDRLQFEAARQCVPLTYVPVVSTQGPAAARNLGWRAAHAAYIAFTDDDTVPASDWLERGLHHLQNDHVDVVSGRIIVPIPAIPSDYEKNIAGLEHSPFVTANCFYRRDVLEHIGGFDERFTMAWREDTDLWFAALNHGYTCVEADDTVVVHPVRPAPWGISIKEQKKTLFNALLYKKHRQLCEAKGILPRSRRYYAITAAAVLAGFTSTIPFSLSASNMEVSSSLLSMQMQLLGLPLLCASVWLLLTLEFALYRLRGTSHSFRHVTEMLITSSVIPVLSLYWRVVGSLRFHTLYF